MFQFLYLYYCISIGKEACMAIKFYFFILFFISLGISQVTWEKKYTIGEYNVFTPGDKIASMTMKFEQGTTTHSTNYTIMWAWMEYYYIGRESKKVIVIKYVSTSSGIIKGRRAELEVPPEELKIWLSDTGYTVQEIHGLTFRMKVDDNDLTCAVVGDWNYPYMKKEGSATE